jgi:hypothetical protein
LADTWFGITNYLWQESTIVASSEATVYPVSNLALPLLWPGWRSGALGAQWFEMEISPGADIPLVIIDRRHNLTADTTVRVSNPGVNAASASTAANEPIVVEPGFEYSGTDWRVNIEDGGVSDPHYEIPLVYMGEKRVMNRSYLVGSGLGAMGFGSRQQSTGGAISSYRYGDDIYAGTLSFRASGTDCETLDAVLAQGRDGYPVVVCPDDSDLSAVYFMHVMNPFDYKPTHVFGDLWQYELELQEVAA